MASDSLFAAMTCCCTFARTRTTPRPRQSTCCAPGWGAGELPDLMVIMLVRSEPPSLSRSRRLNVRRSSDRPMCLGGGRYWPVWKHSCTSSASWLSVRVAHRGRFCGWVPLVVELTHRRVLDDQLCLRRGAGHRAVAPVANSFFFSLALFQTNACGCCPPSPRFSWKAVLHFHHHEPPSELIEVRRPTSQAVHRHDESKTTLNHMGHTGWFGIRHVSYGPNGPQFSWTAAAVGLTLHALIDGGTIAAAVKAEDGNAMVVWAGLATAMAVRLHKPFDSLTIGTLMAAAGRSTASRHLFTALFIDHAARRGPVLFDLRRQHRAAGGPGPGAGVLGSAFICIANQRLVARASVSPPRPHPAFAGAGGRHCAGLGHRVSGSRRARSWA